MIVYTSYATPRYYQELELLLKSADEVGVPMLAHRVPDRGGWEANTRYKAEFVMEMLETHMEPIVWVDADARFRRRPVLFESVRRHQYDLAVHYRRDEFTVKRGLVDGELLSGTVYFAPTKAVFELLESWRLANERNHGQWEQRNLQDCLALTAHARVRVFELPKEYCLITGGGRAAMGTAEEAVIEHTQASRRLRS